jgi:hypothetical protein
MSDVAPVVVILPAVVGTYALLERRLDRMEARLEQLITDVRGDIVRHLEWHIQGD